SNGLVEKLCDLCADEILMPREWLGHRLDRPNTSLATVFEIASETDLPVHFVLRRIIELELKPWRAVWFEKMNGKVQVVRSEPTWDDAFLAWIEVEEHPESALTMCWQGSGVTKGKVGLRIDGRVERYSAECALVGKEQVLSLLYLGTTSS
ncbi:MAG: ImmA/IrrE family metallo-endopeptidase, partial [Betaproteobacteria bacterium]